MSKQNRKKQTVVAKVSKLVTITLLIVLAGSSFAENPILKEIEDAFIRLGDEVRPCVVNIDAEGTSRRHPGGNLEDIFRFFDIDPREMPKRPMKTKATGSGFIYDKEGHIITNNHVVADTDELTVRLWNGNEYKAEVVGKDPETDLAVIKIDADEDLPAAILGDSNKLKVGQFAIAIGSPRSFEGSLSFGHISALGRENLRLPGLTFQDFIQTDAAINLGNSGGPLCNIDGEVIGINVAIVFGAESLGFAIPVNQLKQVIADLISEGKVIRGYLGVAVKPASSFADALGLPDKDGAFVNTVLPEKPAERAGMQVYDVIRKVNGKKVKDATDLINKISKIAPGTIVNLDIWRDNRIIKLEVDLAERPLTDSQGDVSEETDVLGIEVKPLTKDIRKKLGLDADVEGVLVTGVEMNSPAEEADIVAGEIITEVARHKVTSVQEFRSLMDDAVPGKSLLIRVLSPSRQPGGSPQPNTKVIKVPEK